MRGGTENVYGIVSAWPKPWNWPLQKLNSRAAHIRQLRQYMMDRLQRKRVDDIQFNGDCDGHSLYTVLSVSFPPSPKNELLLLSLDIAGDERLGR
jgi:cysteine desulfurase